MRVTFTMTRLSIAATALLAVAGAGCGDLQSIAQEILDHHNGSSDGGSSSDGSRPTDGGVAVDGSRPTGCFVDGVQYAEGDSFPKDDCTTCYCKAGSLTCAASGKCGGTGVPSASPPPAQYCEKVADTVGASCVDQSSWKEHGTQACASRGLALTDLVFGPACGTEKQGASSVTFVCCGPTAPKPTPTTPNECTRVDGGGGAGSCKPAATWKSYGTEACAALGMSLSDLSYSAECSKTGSDYANAIYTCCGKPAPVPTGKCGVEFNSDGSECKSCWDATGVKVSSSCATSSAVE